MVWSIINFGKYEKKEITLPQSIFKDLDYFFWGMEKGVFKGKGSLEKEADYIYNHATRIKPPVKNYVKHFIYPDKTSYGFDFINEEVAESEYPDYFDSFGKNHQTLDNTPFIILKYIDLYFPRKQKNYDKAGNRRFVAQVKEYIFDGKNATKKRVESFFSNSDNFI